MARRGIGWWLALGALATAVVGCGGGDGGGDGGDGAVDAASDGGEGDAARDARADGTADAGSWTPPEPPWPRTLPPAGELGPVPAGTRRLRAIVHLHSPISHDACDGEGWPDGGPDEACLSDLREALCALRVDVAMLTDHAPRLDGLSFEEAFLARDGDEPVLDAAGRRVGSWVRCPSGHRVLLAVGSENALMPVLLSEHPSTEGRPEPDLGALYDAEDADAVARFRAAGALVLVNHTEGRPLEWLRASDFDGLEIYNLHANVDPRKDTGPGVPDRALVWLLSFQRAGARLVGDLALLAFLAPNHVALGRWDALLASGRRPLGVAGTDAHQNAFPRPMRDGERGDSYRRMMRWFSNHLLVEEARFAEAPVEALREALAARRLLVAFEGLGSPVGFVFEAEPPGGGDPLPVGSDAPVGSLLRVEVPRLPEGHPAEPPPRVRAVLLRVEEGGAVEVARSEDGAPIRFTADRPGPYRVEVHVVPRHAAPYVPDLADELVREVPWVFTNPIFVGP